MGTYGIKIKIKKLFNYLHNKIKLNTQSENVFISINIERFLNVYYKNTKVGKHLLEYSASMYTKSWISEHLTSLTNIPKQWNQKIY